MRVGDSIRKSIDDWEQGDIESSMLHACNSVDGTAQKCFPKLQNKPRFTRLLRENYDVLGPMGAPGFKLENALFRLTTHGVKSIDGNYDLADIIYLIHRCYHGHGQELPNEFSLLRDASGPAEITTMRIKKGSIQLSDRMIFALLAVSVLCPSNMGEPIPAGYYLSFGAEDKFIIAEWWGRKSDFLSIITKRQIPSVAPDFTDWMKSS